MTCHNRIESTIACLEALKKQKPFWGSLSLFLVDDGSTDGTSSAVVDVFPDATVIVGDGSLYWCGGMRLAFTQAILKGYDFYLWLNDDTCIENDALLRLFQTYKAASTQLTNSLIIVGSTYGQNKQALSYGGWRERTTGTTFSTSWEKVPPDMSNWITCDTMNGNCVLISSDVVNKVGNLDAHFTHGIGDLDYGLRAKKAQCQIVIAPGYYGFCSINDGTDLWTDRQLPLLVRWRRFLGPKGFPIKEWMVFSRRHRGQFWVLAWLGTYAMFWVSALFRMLGLKR